MKLETGERLLSGLLNPYHAKVVHAGYRKRTADMARGREKPVLKNEES